MTLENISIDVKTNAGDAAKQFRSLSSALHGVSKTAGSSGGMFGGIGKSAQKATKHTNNFAASLKRIAMYRVLRTIIKEIGQAFSEGLKNAYNYSKTISGTLASAMDTLATKSLTMKNQMGAALGSLLEAITPILLAIINLATRAAQALSALFAAIGGGQYLVANDVAQSWDKAAGAAAKYKNQLLGFDEINRLDEPGGGGGGGLNASNMFHVEELPGWANEIQEDVNNIKNAFNEWWNDPSAEKFLKLLSSVSSLLTDISRLAVGVSFDNLIIPLGTFLDKIGETYGLETNFEKNLTSLRDNLYDLLDAIDAFMNEPSWATFNGILQEFFDILDDIAHLVGDPVFEVLITIGGLIDSVGSKFGKDWKVAETLRKWKKAFDDFDLVTWWNTKAKPWLDNFDLKRDVLSALGLPEDWSIEIEWENITSFFQNLPTNIQLWIQELPTKIKEKFDEGSSQIKSWKDNLSIWAAENVPQIAAKIGDFFEKAPERVGYWMGFALGKFASWNLSVIAWAEETLPKTAVAIGNYFEDFDTTLGTWFDSALDTIKGWKDDVIEWANNELPTLATKIANFFSELPTVLWNIGANMMTSLWSGITSKVDWLGQKISDVFGANGSIRRGLTGFTTGFTVGSGGSVGGDTKKFASGGIHDLSMGSLFVAGEAGAEIVTNMGNGRTGVTNVEQMEAAVANGNANVVSAVYAMANMIVQAVNEIDPDITLDGQSLAQQMYPYTTAYANRRGNGLVTIGGTV